MPAQVNLADDGTFRLAVTSFQKGLLSRVPPHEAHDGGPVLQNVHLYGGIFSSLVGGHWASYAGGSVGNMGGTAGIYGTLSNSIGANIPTLLAKYLPANASAAILLVSAPLSGAGNFLSYALATSGPPVTLRLDSEYLVTYPAGNLGYQSYWSWTQLGNYLILSSPGVRVLKYDGTRLIPLGAKHIADMESGEATWVGGSANTATYLQGTRSRSTGAILAGANVAMTLTPATAWDTTTGLLAARDYTTSDRIHFAVNLDTAANLNLGASYIRFGNAGDTDYFQLAASGWGALVNGWNRIEVTKSAFAITGAPNWNSLAKMTLFTQAAAGGPVTAMYDDVYGIYTTLFPGCRSVTTWQDMLIGINASGNQSQLYYTKIASPDDYNSSANFPVSQDDGTIGTTVRRYVNQVLVGKENSLYSLYGSAAGVYPNYDLALAPQEPNIGISSERSVVIYGAIAYFWWRGQIFRYDGSSVSKISYRIDSTLASNNPQTRDRVLAALYTPRNQIYWWYSSSTAAVPTASPFLNDKLIRYDYVTDAFLDTAYVPTPDDDSFYPVLALQLYDTPDAGAGNEIERVITAQHAANFVQWEAGASGVFAGAAGATSDNVSRVATPWLSADLPDEGKFWKEATILFANNTGSLVVDYRVANHPDQFDSATWTTAATINMAVTGEMGRVRIAEASQWIQLRLSATNVVLSLLLPITLTGHRLWRSYA